MDNIGGGRWKEGLHKHFSLGGIVCGEGCAVSAIIVHF